MNKRISHFFKVINEEFPQITQRKETTSFYVFIGLMSTIFALLIMIVTIINGRYKVVPFILLAVLFYLAATISTIITKKTTIPNIIFCSALFIFMTLAFIFNNNDGIGCNWVFIITPLIMFIAGSNYCFVMGIIFLVTVSFLCYLPPARHFMLIRYSTAFLNAYPIIFFIDFIMIYAAMYQYHKKLVFQNQLIKEMKEKEQISISNNLNSIFKSLINVVNSVEEKEDIAGKHSMRVANFSKMIASKLGWNQEQVDQLYNIALLHDIGKISIPDAILNKPEALTPEERNNISKHTSYGAEILEPIENLPKAYLVAKYHHERYDGKGYPSHLAGTNIPIEARIVALADAFDAMNYNRPYRNACDINYIRSQLEGGRGTQFDPNLVDLFIPICEENSWFRG